MNPLCIGSFDIFDAPSSVSSGIINPKRKFLFRVFTFVSKFVLACSPCACHVALLCSLAYTFPIYRPQHYRVIHNHDSGCGILTSRNIHYLCRVPMPDDSPGLEKIHFALWDFRSLVSLNLSPWLTILSIRWNTLKKSFWKVFFLVGKIVRKAVICRYVNNKLTVTNSKVPLWLSPLLLVLLHWSSNSKGTGFKTS